MVFIATTPFDYQSGATDLHLIRNRMPPLVATTIKARQNQTIRQSKRTTLKKRINFTLFELPEHLCPDECARQKQ
jgi:hypothetical protein